MPGGDRNATTVNAEAIRANIVIGSRYNRVAHTADVLAISGPTVQPKPTLASTIGDRLEPFSE